MGKKKKQEKAKKQKEKLKKIGKAAQKTGETKKEKAGKKVAGEQKKHAVPAKTAAPAPSASEKRRIKTEKSGTKSTMQDAAERFRALGDENRLRILALLRGRELCAGDILKSLSIVQSTLSHHMRILADSGLVKCRRQGKWSYYSVDDKVQEELDSLMSRWMKK